MRCTTNFHKLDKTNQVRIKQRIDTLETLEHVDAIPSKKLTGYFNRYRIRVGNYRMIYLVKNETAIVITAVAHRKQVYKKLFIF